MAADYSPTSIRVKPTSMTRFEFRTELTALVVPDIGVLAVDELPNIACNLTYRRVSDLLGGNQLDSRPHHECRPELDSPLVSPSQ